MVSIWLYCQSCNEVMQAIDGYVEGDGHSCWNGKPKTGKPAKLLRLSAQKVREEIEVCRSEIASLSNRIGRLLRYERTLSKKSSRFNKDVSS